jgi:Gnt-I system low-affinity gluconate transporter
MSVILSVLAGIALLLICILWLRLPAFISLLLSSILTGLFAGLDAKTILDTVQQGMGSTLGFVAVVVGLGAMFGAILEKSGGAESIAQWLVARLGLKNAPLSMVLTGFVVAIPVFFDVAFIILVPIVYALQRKTGKSLLLYAIPLLSGLAITHAFVPPTPGPVAVADILQVDLGWVIALGFLAGIPTALVSGLLFGKYIGGKIFIEAPGEDAKSEVPQHIPDFVLILLLIFIPIILILTGTMVKSGLLPVESAGLKNAIQLLGHPFSALIVANLVVWYVLGIRSGYSPAELFRISSKSMESAGTIILLTGAGGVFKQVLVNTGAGEIIATTFSAWGMPLILFAFLASASIRMLQGSATVAMIAAAGLVAPVIPENSFTMPQLAALVVSIAAGASILSHVNDSGFWLVKEYLGMDEKQTFRSWTVMTTLLALTGFASAAILFAVAG